jgi:hypothetical protein
MFAFDAVDSASTGIANVRYWHKADISSLPQFMSAIGGKADIEPYPSGCPLMTQSRHLHKTKAAPKDRPILEQKDRPSFLGRPNSFGSGSGAGRLHHAAHAAHAAHIATRHGRLVLLGSFGNTRFGGDQQASNRSRILQGSANHLGRVDNALLDHIDIFASLSVVAKVGLVLIQDFADDNRTFNARILNDLADLPKRMNSPGAPPYAFVNSLVRRLPSTARRSPAEPP